MKYRIKAAWKVLRGEWVAQPRLQAPSVWINGQDQYGTYCGTATNMVVRYPRTWTG